MGKIIQDAFFIPDDIETGLATGIYSRSGSIVRCATGSNKGQIVKHLKSVDVNVAEQAQGVGTKISRFAKGHKRGVVFGAIGVGAAWLSGWAYYKWRNREPEVLTEFRKALRIYIDAVREGRVDINKIDDLIVALENLKKYKNYEKISIQLKTEELEVLVNRIYEYTVKLAQDNSIELDAGDLKMNKGTIINLQTYLEAQKSIFEKAS